MILKMILEKRIFDKLKNIASDKNIISYYDYINTVLYDFKIGYYYKSKERVSKKKYSDFYTSEYFKKEFCDLVLSSAETLLKGNQFKDYTFVIIGSESNQNIYNKNNLQIKLGDPLNIPPRSIILINEVFDAQPFHRILYKNYEWREVGICINKFRLKEVRLKHPTKRLKKYWNRLPKISPENYIIDLTLGSESLLKIIIAKLISISWKGLLVVIDYGKSWKEITQYCPFGTARCYSDQFQSNRFLRAPGDQDITCHICWDHLMEILNTIDFKNINIEKQEFFFIKNSGHKIRRIFTEEGVSFYNNRQTVMQIIHPSHMGYMFQILYGVKI